MLEQSKDVLDVGIVAIDGPAMLAFYGETLGLTLMRSLEIADNGTINLFALGSNSIKIMVPFVCPNIKAEPGKPRLATGIRYITIHVNNLDALIERCVSAGASLLAPATDMPQLRYALVTDPDGNAIEFIEHKES